MISRTTIACIIPTVGRETLLRRALPSVIAQSDSFDEIIVVNDSGQDISNEILPELESVRFLDTDGGCGGAAARALGFKEASTSLVVFLDDDDELDTDFCAKLRVIANVINDDVGIIIPDVEKIWTEGGLPKQRARRPSLGQMYADHSVRVFRIIKWFPSTFSGLVVNRNLFSDLPIDKRLPSFHELSLAQGIKELGYEFVYCPQLLVRFYQYFTGSRITSDVVRRIETVRNAKQLGLHLPDHVKESIIIGSILSHMRRVAYQQGFIPAITAVKSLLVQEKPKVYEFSVLIRIGINVGTCVWLAAGRFFRKIERNYPAQKK